MTSVLSPIAPSGATARDPVAVMLTTAPRPVAPVSPVETARAPQPVFGANPAETARNQTQSERPVGPPPAFQINVLQDIRARLADPAKAYEASDEPEQPGTDTAGAEVKAEETGIETEFATGTYTGSDTEPEAAPRPVLLGADPEPPHLLDMKV
ncbi:MAG: hypothetical protein ACK4Y4_11595 [Brevundimonas sp.]